MPRFFYNFWPQVSKSFKNIYNAIDLLQLEILSIHYQAFVCFYFVWFLFPNLLMEGGAEKLQRPVKIYPKLRFDQRLEMKKKWHNWHIGEARIFRNFFVLS